MLTSYSIRTSALLFGFAVMIGFALRAHLGLLAQHPRRCTSRSQYLGASNQSSTPSRTLLLLWITRRTELCAEASTFMLVAIPHPVLVQVVPADRRHGASLNTGSSTLLEGRRGGSSLVSRSPNLGPAASANIIVIVRKLCTSSA